MADETTPGTEHSASEALEHALFEVKRVIVGQDRMVERILVCLLAEGHCLVEGVPGLAKTLTVETFANTIGGTFVRLQFTPDLVPSDLVGTRIYRPSRETFDVELGPLFANFVLADEINRAPAKVQSALLEVMAERHVSIGGTTYSVPRPFLVLATQNPIESEGVYPLPEAQRDRFLMKIVVDYPTPLEEREIVRRMGTSPPRAEQVLPADSLLAVQRLVEQVFVHNAVLDYAVQLVHATRVPVIRLRHAARVAYGEPRASSGWSPPVALASQAGTTCAPGRRGGAPRCCAIAPSVAGSPRHRRGPGGRGGVAHDPVRRSRRVGPDHATPAEDTA
jgi:MoxR-like ATPase